MAYNNTFPINEFFLSVQGEGINSGKLALFLRFGKCNLSCSFCDTKNSLKIYFPFSLEKINLILKHYQGHTNFLILTGGEPLLYDISLLIPIIKKYKYKIAVETNGTLYQDWLKNVDWVTVSPKSKSRVHKKVLALASELKFTITKKQDLFFAEKFMPFTPSYLMPVNNSIKMAKLIMEYLKKSKYKSYFQLGIQLHKVYHFK